MKRTKKNEREDWERMEDNYTLDMMIDITLSEYRSTGDRTLLLVADLYNRMLNEKD